MKCSKPLVPICTGGLTNYSIDILCSLTDALSDSYGMIRTLEIDNTNNKKEL